MDGNGRQDVTSTDVEPTRWLSEAEQSVWRSYIRAMGMIGRALDRDMRSAHDLTGDDYGILAILSEASGRQLRLGELARELGVPKTHLTYRISRLEKAGLVERAECPSDGRGVFAHLTESGWDKLVASAPDHVATVRRHLFDLLDDEQVSQLGVVMSRLVDGHGPCPTDDCDD